jgi:hypothetical protein
MGKNPGHSNSADRKSVLADVEKRGGYPSSAVYIANLPAPPTGPGPGSQTAPAPKDEK